MPGVRRAPMTSSSRPAAGPTPRSNRPGRPRPRWSFPMPDEIHGESAGGHQRGDRRRHRRTLRVHGAPQFGDQPGGRGRGPVRLGRRHASRTGSRPAVLRRPTPGRPRAPTRCATRPGARSTTDFTSSADPLDVTITTTAVETISKPGYVNYLLRCGIPRSTSRYNYLAYGGTSSLAHDQEVQFDWGDGTRPTGSRISTRSARPGRRPGPTR